MEKETIILEQLAHNETPLRQRELAEIAGLSLGMTNGILKKLVDKGFLMVEKLNSRKVKYLLTPEGWKELNDRTQRYLKRTLRSVVHYREAIEKLVVKAREEGYEAVNLVGKSELEFVLEWACLRHEMELLKNQVEDRRWFSVYSERGGGIRQIPAQAVVLAEV